MVVVVVMEQQGCSNDGGGNHCSYEGMVVVARPCKKIAVAKW